MPQHRVYYYDHESNTFADVAPNRTGRWLKAGTSVGVAVILTVLGVGVFSQATATSSDGVAQRSEIDALRNQLQEANSHLETFSEEIADLAATDRELYRTVLDAEPASQEQFQMGVGGADDERFGRFSTPTRELLEQTTETFDRLERQIALQRQSYAELRTIAVRRDASISQEPAILPVRDGRMTSGFGMRFHPILHVTRMHSGVDFAAPVGTPVYATADGTVSFASRKSGYGLAVDIDHPLAGKMTRYGHLTSLAAGIAVGTPVRRGQVIAYSGNSGLSTGPHLHYEVHMLDAARTAIDPVGTFVPGVTPSAYRDLLRTAQNQPHSLD